MQRVSQQRPSPQHRHPASGSLKTWQLGFIEEVCLSAMSSACVAACGTSRPVLPLQALPAGLHISRALWLSQHDSAIFLRKATLRTYCRITDVVV